MKTQTEILGYSVKGRDEVLRVPFVTGLESTERKAKKTLEQMLASPQYSKAEKKTLKVVRILRVTEEVV
jgi:hypothetical protein